MKIAVNTRFLLPHQLEGIGWFTHEIFKRLTLQHPNVQWHFFFDRPYHTKFKYAANVTGHVLQPPARHPLLWHAWFQYAVPQKLKKIKADLFVSTDGFLPLKSPCPTLGIIHDLNFEHQKDNLDKLSGAYMRRYFKKFAQQATRLGTVSYYSREDIIKTYGIEPEKCDVIYNGVGHFFKPLSRDAIQKTKAKYSQGQPYFIFVGAFNPRKNIDGMLKAYALYRQQGGKAKFLLVGEKMHWTPSLEKAYQQHAFKKDIVFTGRLERQALNAALASAQALAFVSHFEGFGIPILEAFKSHVPVITATNSSMPEIARDAALLCPSNNCQAIANAFLKTDNPQVRQKLIEKGKKRGACFSWEQSAEKMWHSIEQTLAAHAQTT